MKECVFQRLNLEAIKENTLDTLLMRISNDIGDQKDISDNLKIFWLKILVIK